MINTLGVDIGNFGVKTSNGEYIPSKITKVNSIFNEKGIILEYNNETFVVGKGNYETETVKMKKENLIPLLLTAIGKSSKEDKISINLAVGLPLTQYKQKKALKSMILDNYKETFIKIDSVVKHIVIEDVVVVPEGIGAMYSIPQKYEFDRNNLVIVDIGGLTTNIFEVDNGEIKNDTTLDIGMLQLYEMLYNNIKKDFVDIKLSYDKLEEILIKGTFLYYGDVISANKYIKKLLPLIKEIYNTLKMKYPVENNQLVIVGGGSKHITPLIKEKIKNTIYIDDVFANAKGYKLVGESIFK